MSGSTLNYSLPYPTDGDPVDVAADIQSLAVEVDNVLSDKADLSSPSLTGVPTAPTAPASTSTTQIATTEFVANEGFLTIVDAASEYAPLDSPNIIGSPTAPTATVGTSNTEIATTEFVSVAISNIEALPSQSGNGGNFLKTDGSIADWEPITTSDVSGLTSVIDGLSSTYAPLNISINTQGSGVTNYSLATTDNSKQVEMTSSSANTVTIPLDLAIPTGGTIIIVQAGSGQTTIVGASGVTVNATPGLKLRTQWSLATLIKRGTNNWLVAGDLSA